MRSAGASSVCSRIAAAVDQQVLPRDEASLRRAQECAVGAEFLRAPHNGVAVRPHSLTAAQAAACGVAYTTAWSALERCSVREGTRQPSRTRATLLVLQVALSLVLLVGSGLFVRSLVNVASLHLGYDVAPILYVETELRNETLPQTELAALKRNLSDLARDGGSCPEYDHSVHGPSGIARGSSSTQP